MPGWEPAIDREPRHEADPDCGCTDCSEWYAVNEMDARVDREVRPEYVGEAVSK